MGMNLMFEIRMMTVPCFMIRRYKASSYISLIQPLPELMRSPLAYINTVLNFGF